MYKLFFSNQELYLNYVGHLERISKAEYLDEFFAKYSSEINSYLSLIYADGSPYKDYISHFGPELFLFDKDKIYEAQNHIKNTLKPNSHFYTIRAHVENNTDDFIALQISNIHSFPLVVEGVYLNDTQITKNTSFSITPKVQSSPMNYESYQFPLAVDREELANSDMNSMKIKFKVKGTGGDSLFSPVLPWKIWDSTYVPMTTLNDFYKVIRKLDFVSLNESKKEVFFRSGNWELNETLIIPQRLYRISARWIKS